MNTDYYYYHNVRATVVLTSKSKANIEWLGKGNNEFTFVRNDKKFRAWGKTLYFPIVVLRNGKPWGDFDFNRLKIHITTRGDFENQLNGFVYLIKTHDPDISILETSIKYVEICTRYSDKYFDDVSNRIKKAEARFFTTDGKFGFDKRVKGKNFITLAASISIDKSILNIKTYRFVENFNERKMKISETILPKIEVQIYNPKNLIEARDEAVPLIKAFQECIGFETSPMIEPEYHLIQGASSLSHNTRLLRCLKEDFASKVVKFPKEITQDDLAHKIACFITPEAKSSDEIRSHADISKSTLQRALKRLEPYLEKRGHTGIGIYYQIDTNLFEQQPDDNKAETRLFTKDKGNKPPKDIDTTNQHHQSQSLSTSNTSNDSVLKITSSNFSNGVIYLPYFIFIRSRLTRVVKSCIRLIHKSQKSEVVQVFSSQHIANFELLRVCRDISHASNEL